MPPLKPGEPTDNIPHDVHPTPATKIAPGVTLWTKDGSKIGNAIVVRRNGHTSSFPGSRDYIPLWYVETDFGNVIPAMQESEIFERWDLGFVSSYDVWWEARYELIKKNLQEGG
jgi:hypothetical protein